MHHLDFHIGQPVIANRILARFASGDCQRHCRCGRDTPQRTPRSAEKIWRALYGAPPALGTLDLDLLRTLRGSGSPMQGVSAG
ncbi:MAG TPA: hypothetical protein VIH59_01630 [Candidatus Tectomicrobia bacterium]